MEVIETTEVVEAVEVIEAAEDPDAKDIIQYVKCKQFLTFLGQKSNIGLLYYTLPWGTLYVSTECIVIRLNFEGPCTAL